MTILAFSLQSEINKIGAYAGFAAIIGLALLILLYFAQARELRRLSDWVDQEGDRLRSVPAPQASSRPTVIPPGAGWWQRHRRSRPSRPPFRGFAA